MPRKQSLPVNQQTKLDRVYPSAGQQSKTDGWREARKQTQTRPNLYNNQRRSLRDTTLWTLLEAKCHSQSHLAISRRRFARFGVLFSTKLCVAQSGRCPFRPAARKNSSRVDDTDCGNTMYRKKSRTHRRGQALSFSIRLVFHRAPEYLPRLASTPGSLGRVYRLWKNG